MKTYQGTKIIKAESMTKTEAEKVLGREIKPATEGEDGYIVEYPDGYKSWSPKSVFEDAYELIETPLDRIYVEHHELNKKQEKLHAFMSSDKFNSLDTVLRAALVSQSHVMKEYANILTLRYAKMDIGLGNFCGLTFSAVIPLLENGFIVRRAGWNGKGIMVFRQVPAHITEEIIPKMQSLPDEAKRKILSTAGHIDYTCQCLIYNPETGRADSWVPSISDVFANDWELVE